MWASEGRLAGGGLRRREGAGRGRARPPARPLAREQPGGRAPPSAAWETLLPRRFPPVRFLPAPAASPARSGGAPAGSSSQPAAGARAACPSARPPASAGPRRSLPVRRVQPQQFLFCFSLIPGRVKNGSCLFKKTQQNQTKKPQTKQKARPKKQHPNSFPRSPAPRYPGPQRGGSRAAGRAGPEAAAAAVGAGGGCGSSCGPGVQGLCRTPGTWGSSARLQLNFQVLFLSRDLKLS